VIEREGTTLGPIDDSLVSICPSYDYMSLWYILVISGDGVVRCAVKGVQNIRIWLLDLLPKTGTTKGSH
jgi:hypothetical protein